MSDDAKAAKELVETLKDGERGFAAAAEKLRDGERPKVGHHPAAPFPSSAKDSGARSSTSGTEYGDDVDKSGTVAASLHRGWISLKDALTGDHADAVLKAAATGEDHAVSEYEDALAIDLSAGFREVVVRQQAAVVAARDEVKALANAK